ncbi:sensor histidine kinase [Ahniella affigens]|nr:ATP-binding protein [Ahniella affigens]
MRPWLRLLLIVLFVNAVLSALYFGLRALSQPAVASLHQVQGMRVTDYAEALKQHADPSWAGTTLALPIDTCQTDCDKKYVVLRVRLPPLPATRSELGWSVYVPFFNEDIQILYQGRPLRPAGGLSAESVDRHLPVTVSFPREPGRANDYVDIVLRAGSAHWQVMSAIYAAPTSDLLHPSIWAQVLGRRGHRAAVLMSLPFLALAIGLALRVRDRRLHGAFALAVLGWIGTTINLFLPPDLLDYRAFTWLYMVGALLAVCMVPRFADALISNDEPRFGRGFLWVLWLGLPIMTLVLYAPGLSRGTRVALPSLILQYTVMVAVLYVLWRFVRYARIYLNDPIAPWVVAFLVALCGVGLYDALHSTSNLFGIWDVSLAPFGLLFLAIAYALDVVRQVYRNHLLVQDHVRELEAAVAAREASLQAQFARMQAVERSEVLGRERRRIMQDMHDGVAGSLASLLVTARIKTPDVDELLRAIAESLNDLRLIVDALGTEDDDLTLSLGRLRARLEPAFKDSGIRLHWQIDPQLDASLPFGPSATLQIYRWVQEAVNNAIRHSGCKTISVSLQVIAAHVILSVSDDGHGLPTTVGHIGLGMASMRERAEAVGARHEAGNLVSGGASLQLIWSRPQQ